jgi:hypothetical protein
MKALKITQYHDQVGMNFFIKIPIPRPGKFLIG